MGGTVASKTFIRSLTAQGMETEQLLFRWWGQCLSNVSNLSLYILNIGRFKHANRDASRLGAGGSGSLGGGSSGNNGGGKAGISGQKDFLTDPPRIPPRLEMLLDMPPVARDIQVKHAWNQDDR